MNRCFFGGEGKEILTHWLILLSREGRGGGDNGYGIWGFMFERERGGVEGCYHSYVIYFWLIYDSAPGHVTK